MILFTADWHICLRHRNIPKEWSTNRYRSFFNQVNAIEADMHIIGGDVFDRLPSLEELDLYFEFVKEVKIKTLLYTGNHESTKKEKSFFTYLKGVTERLNPLVEVVVDYIYEEDFNIVPYEYIKRREIWDKLNPVPTFTHIRGEIPPHVKPEIPLEWLDKFPIVFAGDLHSHSNTQRNIVYPGSPMTTSFHRSKVETGYLLINDDWTWEWHKFDLPQLIRKTVSDPADMVPTDYDLTIYELEGNIKDLSKVEHSDLLDKKIVRRTSDTTLILDKKLTISEELVEYLKYIQDLPDKEIESILGVFHEYHKTTQA
jgi:DNA repair exonuclease SbcCD nuclease subunit